MAPHRKARAFAFALCLLGCGSADDETPALATLRDRSAVQVSSQGNVALELQAAEAIKLGRNTVFVSFPAASNVELASATALMPAHGHGSPAPKIERGEDGRYVIRDLVFYMSGRWELRLGLRHAEHADEALVGVDVP